MKKICKEHGTQNHKYCFCPHCGKKLEEVNKVYILESIIRSQDKIENLALLEARGTAWSIIGISGPIAHLLAHSDISPKELKEVLSHSIINSIGLKTKATVEEFTENDFNRFSECYAQLKKQGSWSWQLAKWYYAQSECTNGEYEIKKVYFKNHCNTNNILKEKIQHQLKYPVGCTILWAGDEYTVLANKNDIKGRVKNSEGIVINNFYFTNAGEEAKLIKAFN